MPVYRFDSQANYGDGESQDIAIRAFLGLAQRRDDSDDWDSGFYFNMQKNVGGNLEPSGANLSGYYLSRLLAPDFHGFQSRYKQLVHKSTIDAGVDVYYYHMTAGKSSDGYAPYCLYFDGADDTVNCGNNASLNPSADAFSVEFIIYLTESQNFKYILDKDQEYRVAVRNNAFNEIAFGVYVGGAWRFNDVTAWTSGLSLHAWHHISCVYDGVEIRVYVDGVEQPGSQAQAGNVNNTANNLYMGYDGSSNHFKGFIDGVKGYDGVLRTAGFIPPLKSGPSPVEESDTMFLYYLDEGTGTSAYDRSGNGNTGTLSAPAPAGPRYWPDGYGWTQWILNALSDEISDLWYIDPPDDIRDSAKGRYYRWKLTYDRPNSGLDLETEYVDTYYQGEVTAFYNTLRRRQEFKEAFGVQALITFDAVFSNAAYPDTDQDFDRYFNFDSANSEFAQFLTAGGLLSVQAGYRNAEGKIDYWRPWADGLKNNMRNVKQADDGKITIYGVIGKPLTKDTVELPMVENVKHVDLVRNYLIKDEDKDGAETEYDKYYEDFVDETGEKTLVVIGEWVGEALLCPDWSTDPPLSNIKTDETVWILPNVYVHASCTDENYVYVVFKAALPHPGAGDIACLQIRRANKDGSPVEEGVVGNIFCDRFGYVGPPPPKWDNTNEMMAGGCAVDDDYVYVSYWEQAGDGNWYSVIARVAKTGQNLYGNFVAPVGDDAVNNRIYFEVGIGAFVDLEVINGIVLNPSGEYLFGFTADPVGGAYEGKYKHWPTVASGDTISSADWESGIIAHENMRDYSGETPPKRGFGLTKDESTPGGYTYRCTWKDQTGGSEKGYLGVLTVGTGAIDIARSTEITHIWDDDPGNVYFVWNICIIGHYIYGSGRSTEYGGGGEMSAAYSIDAGGLGKLARYGYWLEAGHVQYQGHLGFNRPVKHPYPLIMVGGELLDEQGSFAGDVLETDDFYLDLLSGEIWFKMAPGTDEDSALPKLLLEIRGYYDYIPSLQYASIPKDTERWAAIQMVCDGAGFLCSPSPDGRLKFRDVNYETLITLDDADVLEHEIMYDEGDNDWINDGDPVDARAMFVCEDDDGVGGTAATEAWIELTAFKNMTIDRLAVYLLPIAQDGSDGDFPNSQYSEGLLIDIEMGQMHAVNDHAWATAGTAVKADWPIPYVDPPNPNTPLLGKWYYIKLDTPFVVTTGNTYGIRFAVSGAPGSLQGAICNWAIGLDNSKTDAVTRYSVLSGDGVTWTNLDDHAACRLYSGYEPYVWVGDTDDIIYTYWQDYAKYIDMTFTPSRNVATGEVLEISASDVDFPALIAATDIQANGYDLRVSYSGDGGLTWAEIPRVAVHLNDADNGKVYFNAQAAMTALQAYALTYRLYIKNVKAGPPPEGVNNIIYDRFDDRDITGGVEDNYNWTVVLGTWLNNYQHMRINALGWRQRIINDETEANDSPDMVVEADVWHTSGGNKQAGVVFRYQDTNNFIAAFLNKNDDKVHIKAMHGGVWGGVGFEAEAAFPHVANTVYRIRVRTVDDDHEVYIDGTKYIDFTMNFGDSNTFDQAGLFAGGGKTERMDIFIEYVYYGDQPVISAVTTYNNVISKTYNTVKVTDYSRGKTYVDDTDHEFAVAGGDLYVRRKTAGDLDDGDVIYAIYEEWPVIELDAKVARSRSDDKYGNIVTVTGVRRFPSEVPVTVTKYVDVPKRKPTDPPFNVIMEASRFQRLYGSKQEDWRDDEGQFEEDVNLSGFGVDIEFEASFILGEPVLVAVYGDASEYYYTTDVPFNYPLPAGYDDGNWDGEEVWDLGAGPPPVRADLYFKATRTGFGGGGDDGQVFPISVPPQSIRLSNYKEWRKRVGATFYDGTPSPGIIYGNPGGGAGWYWRLKHMNDNYEAVGTKLMAYPLKRVHLSTSLNTYAEIIRSQRKNLYVEVWPLDELNAVLFDSDAVDPSSNAIADENILHVVSVVPTVDGLKIRVQNKTDADQRLRILITGYQANVKKIIHAVAEDQGEIATHGRRKLPDYQSEAITTTGLANRRAHEILEKGLSNEEYIKNIPFNRIHLDVEAYDIAAITDVDTGLHKTLFKVLGYEDELAVGGKGESGTKATALMRLPVQ